MGRNRDMLGLERRSSRLAIVWALSAVCLVVIVFLLTDVRAKLSELQSSPSDNVQWTLTQLEVEFLEFSGAVQRAALSGMPDTAALARVRQRYDILYSRLDTLERSPLYRSVLFGDGMGAAFAETAGTLRGMVPAIDAPDTELARALPAMLAEVDRLRPQVRSIATIGNQLLSALSQTMRRDMAGVLSRLALASFGLLAGLSLTVMMFRRLATVSERRAQEVMTTSARLETIVSTSQDAILVLDRRGRIENANAAAGSMFARPAAALAGQAVGTLLAFDGPEIRRGITGHDLHVAARRGLRTGHRLAGRLPDGQRFPVEMSMGVTDREGAEICVCVIRDISHRIAAEAELKESRDRALAGERAKARFLGIVSHEMRTPLNGVLGTIELMEDDPDPASLARYLPILRDSTSILLDLINDVLDITRIEGGRPSGTVAFDLDALIASVLAGEAGRARAQGNRLARRPGERPVGAVRGDAVQLRQVLANIVSNAVKFTRNGEVEVSARRTGAETVTLRVADTGIGIAPGDHAAVFEDFVRLDAAVTRQIQGTGLGLGIARRLVRGMGGEITVDGSEGIGSTFTVTLPLPQAVIEPARPAPVPAAGTTPALKVLIAEDNATNRFILRNMLERDGHGVSEAHDGEEVARIAAGEAFDLILMDVSMPRRDGRDATRWIRSHPGPNAATRIVALTAHIGEEIAAELTEAGVDDVATKPLGRDSLGRILAEAAASGRPSAHPATPGRGRDSPAGAPE
ncbi:response regulator [Pseudooceanicola sp. 216_PA32_1]|uniref:histidine kinase n=1 Tax=Pseudooceanicola pacificus TaxID=2676438 RepID=A0A844W8Z1_9RHOB|nr:ATP-binding protein [Pseudooceanicola pacificus]MWB77283.1 response regulator [Pseudooceanicola pacificus]